MENKTLLESVSKLATQNVASCPVPFPAFSVSLPLFSVRNIEKLGMGLVTEDQNIEL